MKKILLIINIVALLLLCACNKSASLKQYEGTWICESFTDFQGEKQYGSEIVLFSDGTGTYKANERYVTYSITWEKTNETTIVIYQENSYGKSVTEYTYKIIDENEYLVFDNEIVHKEYQKQ